MKRVRPAPRVRPSPALRERLLARRRALVERVRARRPARQRSRPSVGWLVAAILLLILLLRECRCDQAPAEAPVGAPTPSASAVPGPVEPSPPPTPRVARLPRPAFEAPAPQPVPWLASFRMQVAARSPRLAACFVGAAAPGALKWTALVDPVGGRTSDHAFEPMLRTGELTSAERACVLAALTEPAYRLDADARSTPSRVSLVLEF